MKLLFLILGFICLGLGSIGIIIPILPTTPFYLAAAFCFAKSSSKLNAWFLSTKLYRNHLDSFVEKRAMAVKTKVSIMASVTVMLVLAFFLMGDVLIGQIVLLLIWVLHMLYFLCCVKTLKNSN